jgi:hypothetical protein
MNGAVLLLGVHCQIDVALIEPSKRAILPSVVRRERLKKPAASQNK